MRYIFLWVISCYFLFGAGTPPVPLIITSSPKLSIYKGWNLLAPPSNFDFSTSAIKNIIDSDIFFFNANSQSWNSGLNLDIPVGVGFWVNVSAPSSIEYRSSLQNPFPISNFKVSKGWNLLGMSLDSERINVISLAHNAKAIYSYSAKDGIWIEYKSYSRDSLKAGMGFWLQTN